VWERLKLAASGSEVWDQFSTVLLPYLLLLLLGGGREMDGSSVLYPRSQARLG